MAGVPGPAINLRAERLNRGLSLAVAAAAIGVDKSTLSRAERGVVEPIPAKAFKIASFYGYRVTDVWPLEPFDNGEAAA